MAHQYDSIAEKLKNKEELDSEQLRIIVTDEFHSYFKKALKRNKKYYYMLTFTIDAKKGETEEHFQKAEESIIGTANRSALQLLQFQYVKEYTKKGLPHWHCLAVTTKALKKDRFNNYIKKYGFVDISRNRAHESSEIINYISKSGTPTVLL